MKILLGAALALAASVSPMSGNAAADCSACVLLVEEHMPTTIHPEYGLMALHQAQITAKSRHAVTVRVPTARGYVLYTLTPAGATRAFFGPATLRKSAL
jgi:hypothetical protein